MNLEELRKRLKEINAELDDLLEQLDGDDGEGGDDGERMTTEEIEARSNELAEEAKSILAKIRIEERKESLRNAAQFGTPIFSPQNNDDSQRGKDKNMTRAEMIASEEYRSAFYANLRGEATEEQRSALLTAGTDAIAIPKALDDKIWDNIYTDHPILGDIDIKRTGVILEVTKHTKVKAGKAGKVEEGTAATLEDNEFVKVTLVGQDYAKTVELSYAAAKMSQGALEDYLATEVANSMGEALATDIFAKIKTDLGAAAVTVAKGKSLTFADFCKAVGSVQRGTNLKVYASRAKKFEQIVGMVDTAGQPVFRDGCTLGYDVKEDAAAGDDIFIVDTSKFVLNMVQDIMIENDRDIKTHKIIISGYARAEGCMRDAGAGAYVTFATA
nr:MAG TPA: major capsid protein [Caudoviricetes sp.]